MTDVAAIFLPSLGKNLLGITPGVVQATFRWAGITHFLQS